MRLPAHDLANNSTCKADTRNIRHVRIMGKLDGAMEHTPQLVSYSRRMDEGSTICAMASWLGRTRRVEQERGAVEMPFVSIRARTRYNTGASARESHAQAERDAGCIVPPLRWLEKGCWAAASAAGDEALPSTVLEE